MRLHELWISDYKNLKDFRIHFDADSPITVIVGWNGTGKSNLFEALVIIFRDLDLNQTTPFAYQIKYTCHGNKVEIDYDPSRPGKERLKKTVAPIHFKLEGEKAEKDLPYLPTFVFAYYSGTSTRLKELFLDHQQRYYTKLLYEEYSAAEIRHLMSNRKYFYAETHHNKYVLLSFYLKEDDKLRKFLLDSFRIEGLESVLFVMKKPEWGGRKSGDQRFWGAFGLVQKVLSHLYSVALAPMRLTPSVQTGITNRKRQEFLYLFIKDIKALSSLARDYATPSDFFASLESTDLSDVIQDVIIKVIAIFKCVRPGSHNGETNLGCLVW